MICPPVRRTVGDVKALGRQLSVVTFFYPAAVPRDGGGYTILAGERRWLAMRSAGLILRVHCVDNWSRMLAWMIQDEPSVGSTCPSLVEAMEMIERITSKIRTTRQDAAERTICEYLHVNVDRVREVRTFRRWLDESYPPEVREAARREIKAVHRGETSPGGAEGRMRRLHEKATAPNVPAATQRRTFQNAVHTALGLADALGSIGPLAEELTKEERAEWVAQLGKSRLAIERTIRQLKERGSTT